MIIEKVIINTFGGLSKKEIDLKDGMNVVVGPNESGKSTVYNAIKNALFTPSKLTPAKFQKQMGCFIPVAGGDTIEVTIHFKNQGNGYALQRKWGASVSSSLTLADGSIITDDDSIQDVIKKCIKVPEATCKTIMMTYQSGLSRTVRDIQEDKETSESIGDLLRKAVMEMDGVSVDAFRAKTEDSYKNYFGRWDIDANYPEGNRGIETPWKKGAGIILSLFYEKEEVSKALEDDVRYEEDLDDLNKRISDHAIKTDKVQSYVKNNKKLKDDVVKRRQIEAEIKGLQLEYEKLEKINKAWPVYEAKADEISKKLPELESKITKFNKERESAESYQKGKQLLDKYNRVEKKKQVVDKADKSLENVNKLTGDDLKSIRELFNKKTRLDASLLAGKLSVKFTSKKDIEFEIKKGIEDKSIAKTKRGQTLDFQALGRLLLSHPEWDLEVKSGEVEYDEILTEYEKLKANIKDLLQKFNIKSLEEAESVNATYEAELVKLKNAQSNLKEELGEDRYEELGETIKRIQLKKPKRDLGTILNDLADAKAETKGLKDELSELKEKLCSYVGEFGDHHKLLERLAEVAGSRKQKQGDLGKLKLLPAEVENVDEFIKKYEEMESSLKGMTEEHHKLIQQRIQLEAKSPDRSVEEFERDLAEAEERFNVELRKGLAIARIKKVTEELLGEMDEGTYSVLEQDVAELMQKMTGGRYEEVVMEESVPSGFRRKDGVVMPYENLSTGTKDVLGIALRLAITKRFLEEKEGFIIMDDPLVDLDPDRQSKAAEAIKDFAENKQLILLTCHPAHAKILGGNRIELSTSLKTR
jgi:exonuclease SbcC